MHAEDLETCRRRLFHPWPLIGDWLAHATLRTLAGDGSAEAIRLLEEAVGGLPATALSNEALDLLKRQAGTGNVPAREALCRLVIYKAHRQATEFVRAHNLAPSEESQRALFFFLEGRWQEYESLDFDRRLLRQAYEIAEPFLRRRLADKARSEGRVDWVEVASGGIHGKRLAHMSSAEWRAALTILVENERWQDLSRLAQEAPPMWSAAIWRRCPVEKLDVAVSGGSGKLRELADKWPAGDFADVFFHRHLLTGHKNAVRSLAIDSSGRFLASGSTDRSVHIWSLEDRKSLAVCSKHGDWVSSVAFLPGSSVLVSAGRDGRLCSWRAPGGQLFRRYRVNRRPIVCMGVCATENLVAAGSADGTFTLWDPLTGKVVVSTRRTEAPISCLAVSPDSSLCATAGSNCRIRLWNLPAGTPGKDFLAHTEGEGQAILCLAISPDGSMLASGGTDGMVCLWNLPGGSCHRKMQSHHGHVTALAFSGDSQVLVSGGDDACLRLWRTRNGDLENTLTGHLGPISSLALHPSGHLLASSGGGGLGIDRSVRLWDVARSASHAVLGGHDRAVAALAFSPTGTILCTGAEDGTIALWTAELDRLARLPVARATLEDLAWLDRMVAGDGLGISERSAMNFIAALIRWRRRSDILVEEARPRVIELGEFDIEIEG